MVEEVTGWVAPAPELVARLRAAAAELAEIGIEALDD